MDPAITPSERVRVYARKQFIEPARQRGQSVVRIVAGDVQRALRLHQRTPLVCAALKSHKFLKANRLTLEKIEGPASGQSTTVAYTYRIAEVPAPRETPGFVKLRGIAKATFHALGGGEAFVRGEREAWGTDGRRP